MMQKVPVQKIFMNKNDKRVLEIFQIFKLDDLARLGKQHAAIVMIVFSTAIHNDTQFEFFNPII